MKVLLLHTACAYSLLTGLASAQAPGQGPPPIVSPEILPDGRVTFRLLAPDATSVSVTGDWPGGIHSTTTPMVKDDTGVWSATVGPLKPEFWIYTFSVNGVTTLDPRNVNTRRNTTRIENTLLDSRTGVVGLRGQRRPARHGVAPVVSLADGRRDAPRLRLHAAGLREREPSATRCSTCCTAAAATRTRGRRAGGRRRSSTT